MKPVVVPAALTLFAAAIVTVAFLPDQPQRVPIDPDELALTETSEVDAVAMLANAMHAGRTTAFEGTLTVVGIDGPSVFQMDVTAGMDGSRTVDSGAWLFGRDRHGAWASSDEGQWLENGVTADLAITVGALHAKYDVEVRGVRALPTGDAWLVALSERELAAVREWLSIDVATGLLVRRETFDARGAAIRLVAFETLRTMGRVSDLLASDLEETPARVAPLPGTWNGIAVAELPGHFRLVGLVRHSESDMPPLTMQFSDGLYRLSVSPIPGELDRGRLDGAVARHHGDLHLYHWPGAEPQRLVWSGAGHTFTAITDAPMDAILPALERFPGDPAPSPLSRMRRGLERVADTLWPFD